MKQTYWISGGSGSLGTALTLQLTSQGHHVRAFSRNEHKLAELKDKLPAELRDSLSLQPGSVEDLGRVMRSMRGADIVIHAAAMKRVDTCGYSPSEAVKTNINGTANVVDACVDTGIKRAVFISSDKACSSINHYGHTKAAGEKLWLHGNNYAPKVKPFVAVRYGNCWNSNGSVLGQFVKQARTESRLKLTDPEATRFHWKLTDAVAFVMSALDKAKPGELWIPKLPAYKLDDLAAAFMSSVGLPVSYSVIGLQPGEKLHESMISDDEAFMAKDDGDHYVITPGKESKAPLHIGYHSSTPWRVKREDLEALIRETVK